VNLRRSPAAGTDIAFKFTGLRHIPLAAQRGIYIGPRKLLTALWRLLTTGEVPAGVVLGAA
jgi:hypothetical protein